MVSNQSWKTEFSRSFKNIADLYRYLGWELSDEHKQVATTYPVFIPINLANKIKNEGPDGILAREFLPHELELDKDLNQQGLEDPIGDKDYHVAPQLIHRYQSRALFTPTTICPVHCRYCFRKNELNAADELFGPDFEQTQEYLKNHPEISELIFTGGDPLTLSNERLKKYLAAFAAIPSIKDIRFHTRYPVILPERIDEEFLTLMEEFSAHFRTITMAIHANHINEFDETNKVAIRRLAATPLQLLSQTVLLSGINDRVEDLLNLFEQFMELKIRPYYLHHPDRVKGGMHFYLPLIKGRELYLALRKHLPGWALPHYVIDLPGGHGKISAMNPETTTYSGQFLTKDGATISLQEPDFFI